MKLALIGTSTLLALALSSVAKADFLNGSFELPALAADTQAQETPTDWTSTGETPEIITNGFIGDAVTWNQTPDGNQFLYANPYVYGGITLSQEVALTAGANTLSFLEADFGTEFETPGGAVDVSIFNSSNTQIASQNFTTPNYSGFIQQTLNFTAASAGTYDFVFTSVTGHAEILDGVTVAAVPEPAPIAILGLSGLVLLLRRR